MISSATITETQMPPLALDRAARWPLLFLLVKSAGWLVVGLGLLLVAQLKLFYPGWLTDSAWLTYGRLVPAAQHALLYGFASQAGLAVALWMLARLGGVALAHRWLVCLGGGLWNLGAFLGWIGILAGDATGYFLFAAPLYGTGVMWFGLLGLGVAAWHTLQRRQRAEVYPSQWWAMAGMFWLFWIFTAGVTLLHCAPPRGVMQLVVSTWVANNLMLLWLSAAGLAAVFYFVPRLSGRPLHSVALSKTVFWVVAAFGTLGGFHEGMPLPRWLPAVSAMGELMLVAAVLALALNLHGTLGGRYRGVSRQPALWLMAVGAAGWMVAVMLQGLLSRQALSEVVAFSWLAGARAQWWLLGFAVPVMTGALWHVLPRLAGREWPAARRLGGVVMVAVTGGLVLWWLGMLWAGNAHASVLADPRLPFAGAVTAPLAGLKLAALGLALMTAGAAAVGGSAVYLGLAVMRETAGECCRRTSANLAPAEVAS